MNHSRKVLLCADGRQLALMNPTMPIGEATASWLVVRESAQGARGACAQYPELEEAWVFSSEEVEGINLAAALKADAPGCRVYLAGCAETGSVRSRVGAAGLDGVLTVAEIARRIEVRTQALSSADAPSRAASGEESKAANGFLLTVVSGSGGAGKSTLATVLAHLGARRGLSVALVDADLQFGDLRELGGAHVVVSLDDIAEGISGLPEAKPGEVALVAAPRRLELSEVLADKLDEVVGAALGCFELVVVNTGGSWTEQHAQLLERSAAAVFLVDQRASSVRACRHALDLCLRCGIATGSFLLALNRCTRHGPFTSIDVSSALQGAHVIELADGGREVEELLGSGMAVQLVSQGNDLCSSADRVLDELLPIAAAQAPAAAMRPKVMGRIGRRGSRARGGRRPRDARKRAEHIGRRDPIVAGGRG